MQTVEVKLNFLADTSQAESALTRLQSSLKNVTTQQNLDTGGYKMATEINAASEAAIKLRQNLQSAINVNTGQLDLSRFTKEMSKSGMSLEKYRTTLAAIGPSGQAAFADLAKAIVASETPLTRSIGLMNKLWDTLKRTAGWQISSNIMHGLQSALSNAYGYAQDLNESLNDIRIVTGHSADKMADFAKQANKAAKELSSTTLAYTDASLIYYQQGLDDSTVKERTDTTIKMANVTGTTAETVSEQLTAVWENFQTNGEHTAEYYADVMTALGAATASSTDEIAEGLQKFVSVADTIGLSYEYAASALTTITAKTRQSADVVGTALKTIFARLEGLSLGETLDDGTSLNKYSNALAAVGVDIKDASGSLKDMDTILDETAAKWSTLSRDQQMALAQTVAGTRQYTQFVSLMDNWDFMEENLATSYSAEGTLDEQLAIYEESWKAAANRLSSAAEAIYDDLLSDDFFIWLTDGLADVVGLLDKIIDSMGGLAGVLPGLILLMNKLFGDKIMTGISNVAYNVAGLIPSIKTKRDEADQQTRTSMIEQLQEMYKSNNDTAGQAMASAYSRINDLQKYRLENAKLLNSTEQETLDVLIEQAKYQANLVEEQGSLVQQLERNNETSKRHLRSSASGYDVGPLTDSSGYLARNFIQSKKNGKNRSQRELGVAGGWTEGKVRALKSKFDGQDSGMDELYQYYSQFNLQREEEQETDYNTFVSRMTELLMNGETAENTDLAKFYERIQEYMTSNRGQEQYLNDLLNTFTEVGAQQGKLKNLQDAWDEHANALSPDNMTGFSQEAVDDLRNWAQALKEAGVEVDLILPKIDELQDNGSFTSEMSEIVEQLNDALNSTATGGANQLDAIMQALAKSFNIDTEELEQYRQELEDTGDAQEVLARMIQQGNSQIKKQNKVLNDFDHAVSKIQKMQNIVDVASGVAMGLSSLKSAFETIKDPDVSGWDRFTSVLMSAGIALSSFSQIVGGIGSGIQLFTTLLTGLTITTKGAEAAQLALNAAGITDSTIKTAKTAATIAASVANGTYTASEGAARMATLLGCTTEKAATIITDLNTVARTENTGATLLQIFAQKILNIVTKGGIVSVLGLVGAFVLLTAAIAGIVWVISKVVDAFKAQETAQEKVTRQAEEAARATENATNAYEELCNTIDSYESGVEKLKDLKEGTLEFKEALIDTNKQALDLIDKLNLVYGQDWKYDDQGKIVFLDENGNVDEDFTEREKEKQADAVLKAQQIQTHYDIVAAGTEADAYFSNYKFTVNKNTGYRTDGTERYSQSKQRGFDILKSGDTNLSTADLLNIAQEAGFDPGENTMSDSVREVFYQALRDQNITKSDDLIALRHLIEDINASGNEAQGKAQEIDENVAAYRQADAESFYDSEAKNQAETWGAILGLDDTTVQTIVQENANVDELIKTSPAATKYDNWDDNAILTQYYQDSGIASTDEFQENYKVEDGKLKKKNEEGEWEEAEEDDEYYVSTDTAKYGLQVNAVSSEAQSATTAAVIQAYKEEADFSGNALVDEAFSYLVQTEGPSVLDEETLSSSTLDYLRKQYKLTAEDLDKLREARQAYNEMTYDGLEGEQASLAEAASKYSSCSDEVTELTDAVKKYGKESKTAQAAQKKLNQALKNAQWTKFAKNIADSIDELDELDENGDDYKDKCAEIASAWNEIFDPDITQDFVADNIDLFKQWANSSGEEAARLATEITLKATAAADTVNTAFTDALSWKGEDSAPTGFENTITDMQGLYAATEAFLKANPLEIDAEGRADLSPLLEALAGAGATAEQVAMVLAAIGQTEVEIDGTLMTTTDLSAAGDEEIGVLLQDKELMTQDYKLKSEAKGDVPAIDPSSIMTNASGGSGGGSSSKTKKKASDEIDRYHVVKQQIDRLSSEYDQLSAAKDRAYGPDKLAAIDKEIAKLQEQEAAQKKYIDEINSYYAKDKAAIAAYGAVFDKNGIITNYDSLMQSQIDKFNASLTDEAEEAYDEFKEILDQYEETLSLKLEEMNSLVEKQYEILSAKLEQISYKVEFKVDLNETELNQLERKLSRLEDREIKSAEYFSINNDEAVKYWQQYAYYQNGIFETEQLINETKAKGLEVTEEMIEQLNEYKEKLGEIHDEIYEVQVNNLESMLDNWDQQYEKLESLNEQVETYRDILETIKDMRELSGMLDIDSKHSLDNSMISSYKTSLSMSKGINEALVKQRAELVKAQKALVGGESTKGLAESMKALDVISDDMDIAIMSAETLGGKIKSKIDEIDDEVLDNQADYLSLAQEYLEYIKDAYVSNIELIGKKIKDELYDGIDWAVEKYGDLTELSELYLSDTKKNYELNKLNRNIMQDINKLDSVAQKQKLRDLMEDISGYYADNVKMSEYELKNLQAQYELRLAEIALEEAQEAKSQVRLTRDNEGRWGYMYTANTEDLAQAEQEYEDKLYALQELQEDTLNETGEKILSTQQEYIDALLEIQQSDEYTDEQKAQRIQSLTDIYQQQLDAYYNTYDKALAASGLAYEDTILGQASNTRSLREVAEQFGQSTTTMIEDINKETESFQAAFTEMVRTITGESIASYEEAQTAWMKYLGDQQTAWSKATTDAADNFSSVMSTFDDIAVKFKELIQDMLAQLALLSGEDMSKLIRQSLAAGDYDMAVTYANARRAKIDANPSEYAKNDWDETRMRQEINQYAKDPSAITEDQMKDMLATAKEVYNSKADYAGEMQKALAAGEYDKAGLYAEYRALKVHNDPTLSKYAWTQADLQKQIEEWAKDPNAMTDEQKRRILATASQYDTGGYTGAWGSEGKLAILHEKELVLNSDDTAKLLDAMKVVAQLDRMSAWAMLGNLQAISATANQDVLEQNVHIEASFPNVVDHNEIEQAFENIVNLASQYANRK